MYLSFSGKMGCSSMERNRLIPLLYLSICRLDSIIVVLIWHKFFKEVGVVYRAYVAVFKMPYNYTTLL